VAPLRATGWVADATLAGLSAGCVGAVAASQGRAVLLPLIACVVAASGCAACAALLLRSLGIALGALALLGATCLLAIIGQQVSFGNSIVMGLGLLAVWEFLTLAIFERSERMVAPAVRRSRHREISAALGVGAVGAAVATVAGTQGSARGAELFIVGVIAVVALGLLASGALRTRKGDRQEDEGRRATSITEDVTRHG
jgi:hypothetical protein